MKLEQLKHVRYKANAVTLWLPLVMCNLELFVCLAPQEVTQVVVDVISDSRIQVQWGPPARSNGILTYYTITVFNQQTGFNFSSQINASAAEVITVGGLSMFRIQKKKKK